MIALKKKINRVLSLTCVAVLNSALFISCEDSVSGIGGSLTDNEVAISVDSTFTVTGISVYEPVFDARSTTLLLGKLNCPQYGDLKTSFVAQLMPSTVMDIPDSITVNHVDSMRMKLNFVKKHITGDSIAPQQLKIYALNKQLPSSINSDFDPSGYFSKSDLLGLKNYTASALGMNDSLQNQTYGHISVKMPITLAKDFFNAYRTNPEIFAWPQTFAKYFPGIYVENSFGSGCVINISSVEMSTYYHYKRLVNQVENGVSVKKEVNVKDSVTLFCTAPEVLSSNIISIKPSRSITDAVSAGKVIISSPCGYHVRIKFPAQEILDKYWSSNFNLAVINNLVFTLPVKKINNNYGITPPPYLLMVKTGEISDFFKENRVPDNKTCFWGSYDDSTGSYIFTSMRTYIVELMKNGRNVDSKDTDFTLIPVSVTTETNVRKEVVVTKCTPYLAKPVMGEINLKDAKVKFTFSTQHID